MAHDREVQLRRPDHRRRRRRAARGDRRARGRPASVAVICKSLFGKAHTVMAEGGCAAAMGNVNSNDNWQVHFRDTMRGGKFLNNWRMAELHAKEAPDRVWELETYGALFDRTKDGKISQRNFGGHEYPRLAHVGDRTGLELIRTMQQKIVSLQQDDARKQRAGHRQDRRGREPAEGVRRVHRHRAAHRRRRRDLRRVRLLRARPASSCCSRRRRSCSPPAASASRQGHLELVGVHRRRHGARAARRFDAAEHGVRPVPPDRHGLAPVGEGHPRHRGRARRRRRAEATPTASGSCSTTCRTCSARSTRTPRPRPTAGTRTRTTTAAPPDLLPRDEVARAINSEVKAGRGSPHGGVFLDIASRLPREPRSCGGCRRCTTSSRNWPTSTSPRSRWRSARPATT